MPFVSCVFCVGVTLEALIESYCIFLFASLNYLIFKKEIAPLFVCQSSACMQNTGDVMRLLLPSEVFEHSSNSNTAEAAATATVTTTSPGIVTSVDRDVLALRRSVMGVKRSVRLAERVLFGRDDVNSNVAAPAATATGAAAASGGGAAAGASVSTASSCGATAATAAAGCVGVGGERQRLRSKALVAKQRGDVQGALRLLDKVRWRYCLYVCFVRLFIFDSSLVITLLVVISSFGTPLLNIDSYRFGG